MPFILRNSVAPVHDGRQKNPLHSNKPYVPCTVMRPPTVYVQAKHQERVLTKSLLVTTTIIAVILLTVINLFAGEMYDLCYRWQTMNNGKLLFVRYKNPTLEAVLRTYEIYLYNPATEKITLLQKPEEQIYLLPVVSRDRSTVNYHSLIEGNDFLVTRNVDTGYSTRLRFDTGGYFLNTAIHYDNNLVVSVEKRGENKEALYLISNSEARIKRIFNGHDFQDVGFFRDGSVFYTDIVEDLLTLGIVRWLSREDSVIDRGIDFVEKAPNGKTLLYAKDGRLTLFRENNNEKIELSRNFIGRPLFSEDGSTAAIIEKDAVHIVNLPSGDILYFLSFNTENTTHALTNFTFYIARENRIYQIKHKKPGQALLELTREDQPVYLLAASQNDRFLYYRMQDPRTVILFDNRTGKKIVKTFPFEVREVLPQSGDETDGSFYIRSVTPSPTDGLPIRELYLFKMKHSLLVSISTAEDTDIRPYRRVEK
jgi:WD40 repeat protein